MASVATSPPTQKPVNKAGVTITAMLAMISMIMSSTMVNVAIPDIMGAFGIGQDEAHWISTGFLAAMTAGMLLNAWLVTNFGLRRTIRADLRRHRRRAFLAGPLCRTDTAARHEHGVPRISAE
jgi:MFS family permease